MSPRAGIGPHRLGFRQVSIVAAPGASGPEAIMFISVRLPVPIDVQAAAQTEFSDAERERIG
jgi:hypothetical protein